MAKYKKINESIVDNFLERMFAYLAKDRKSQAIDALKKKDPEFARAYAEIEKGKEKIRKRLKKMTRKEIDAEIAKIVKNLPY
jgi:predicted phage tail protein